jgi:hypothetical protein
MIRVVIAVLLFLAVSSDAIAQTTLPTVTVTGMRINRTTLCEGDACRDFFNTPHVAQPPPGYYDELSDVEPTEPDRPECSGDETSRESAVWVAYKAAMLARFGTNLIGMLLADKENWGETLTIVFSNGSTGQYTRSDSALNGSHGFFEIKAPNCG